MDKEQS